MTIISNNCSGAYLYHDLGLRFNSPTINLQILPGEYTKFCKNLKEYMSNEVREYKDLSKEHQEQIHHLLGCDPYFPVGILGDIAILFQHYKTFDEAKQKWDERKQRIDYNHIKFIFVLEKPYIEAAMEFGNSELPNAVLFQRNFKVSVPMESYTYHIPPGSEYLAVNPRTKFRYFMGDCTMSKLLRGDVI